MGFTTRMSLKYFEEIRNVKENTIYNTHLGKKRVNSLVVFKHKEEIENGKIERIRASDNQAFLSIMRYNVVKDDVMKIDDLFLDLESFIHCIISPDAILCKFITIDYDKRYKYVVTPIHKSFY